jgi:TetR/AcrR family transcriptional repressor of nem operon
MARAKLFSEEEILDKAMRLFWEKGYNATSAQDLVDGLGISRSSLYDTYGDKHSLFVAALKRYRKERIDPVLDGIDTATDLEQYIQNIFEAIIEEALNDECSKGCFMINSTVEMAPVDSEIASIANTILHDTEAALTKAIRKGQQEGIFTTKCAAHSLANFLINVINGLRVTVKFDTNKKMYDDIVTISLGVLKG